MPKAEGILFDVDGTLFDTASLVYDAYCHLADYFGYPKPTRDRVAHQMGKPIPEIMSTIFPGADVDAMMQQNTEFVMKRASAVAAYEGLEQVIRTLHEKDLVLGILTSGNKKVFKLLEQYNLEKYFSSVVHEARVKLHKPYTEGFLLAAEEMKVDVDKIVMVGDMRPDIDVAANAGALASVGVTHGFSTREQLTEYGANFIIDTLDELPEIIERIGKTA